MITFTLILTTAIFSNHGSVPAASISTTQVQGFATYEDCTKAGLDTRIPADRKYYETDKTWTCVQVRT